MIFKQGNKTSIPFDVKKDKAIAQFVLGIYETDNKETIKKLIALGYEHDGEFVDAAPADKRKGRTSKEA